MTKRVHNNALNLGANAIVGADVRVFLNSEDPGASGTTGRFSAGGTSYQEGVVVAASVFTDAANGDVWTMAATAFGQASAETGTPTHYSVFTESSDGNSLFNGVFLWSAEIDSRDQVRIGNGDSYSIRAGGVRLNSAQAA